MKPLLLLSVVAWISAGVAQSKDDALPRNTEIQHPFVGAWKLVSLEQEDADGQLHKVDSAGLFVFTADGKASVQVMYRNAQADSAYVHGHYEASYGNYHIDDCSSFTFHVEGALVATLIGKDLKRAYRISGNRLTVRPTDPNEHWEVVWEHY